MMPRPLELLVLLGILVLAFWVSGVWGAELKMAQGEPPLVASWEIYVFPGLPTPVATVLPTHLTPITPPPTFPVGPGTPTPETVKAYKFDIPAIPENVLVYAISVGFDLDEEGQPLKSDTSNLIVTNSNTPTPSVTPTVTRTPTKTATAVPTRTKKPKPHKPWLFQ